MQSGWLGKAWLGAAVGAAVAVVACNAAVAQSRPEAAPAASSVPAASAEVPRRQLQHHEEHRIERDGRTVSTFRSVARVQAASALDAAKQVTITVSRSAQQMQVLEAYTLKPDGRRIDVPAGSWQVRRDSGQAGQSPIFSDYDSTTLVYPDVAVGDTVVLVHRVTTTEPLFPGKVSLVNSFSRSFAIDDLRVEVNAPVDMPLKTQVFDLQESQRTEGDRRITTWTWRNPVPVPETRKNWSVFDVHTMPGYLLSSFTDWGDVARSYVQRATPKAVVTPEVQALSDRLVEGLNGDRAKAQALHTWVATQVGYVANLVGIGAVVPRDLSVVLQHRLGDCKDHATLLQALLAAQGIGSRQVLVNVGSLYRLPQVPVASMVNHVITYIPALNLFVDSTDPNTSFGRLPMLLYAKPVLSDDPAVPRQIPNDPGGHSQTMKTTLAIGDDGSVQGQVDLELTGYYALQSRSRFRAITPQQRQDFVRELLRAANLQGEGTLALDDPQPLTDRFHLSGSFQVKQAIPFPGTGAMGINPWYYSEAPVMHWAQQAMLPVEPFDSVCSAGRSVEEYDITLPPTMRVLAAPESSAANTPYLGYEATYTLDGQRLKVRRVLDDRTPASVCSADVMRQFQEGAKLVLKDLRQQLLYR